MNTMTRERRILTSTERENFEKVLKENESDKKETDSFYPMDVLVEPGVDAQERRIKSALKKGEPEPLNAYKKQELEKEAKQIGEWLSKNMVPKTGVNQMPSNNGVQNTDFRRAVNLMAKKEMSSEFTTRSSRYKNIMRLLGREEDGNIENLRPSS